MKKFILSLLISVCFLSVSAFANQCLDEIDDHIYNMGTMLMLQSCEINDRDMVTVAAHLQKLPNIFDVVLDDNNITAQGVMPLKTLTTVTVIDISHNKLGPDGAAAVVQMPNIKSLLIDGNNIGDEGAKALARNKRITTLFAGDNNMTPAAIRELISNSNIEMLSLTESQFDKDALIAISNMKNLIWLDVSDSNISPDDAVLLVANMKKLRNLSIAANPIGNKGINAIAQKSTIEVLIAYNCSIGAEGAIAVSKMPHLADLNMNSNHIYDEGAAALTKLPYLRTGKFGFLLIGDNDITDDGVTGFADHIISFLSFEHNSIGNKGAIELAKSTKLSGLNLSHNNIGKEGIEALQKSAIKYVNIDGNVPLDDINQTRHSYLPKLKHYVSRDTFDRDEILTRQLRASRANLR